MGTFHSRFSQACFLGVALNEPYKKWHTLMCTSLILPPPPTSTQSLSRFKSCAKTLLPFFLPNSCRRRPSPEHCGIAIYMIGLDSDLISFRCEACVRGGLQTLGFLTQFLAPSPSIYSVWLSLSPPLSFPRHSSAELDRSSHAGWATPEFIWCPVELCKSFVWSVWEKQELITGTIWWRPTEQPLCCVRNSTQR